MSRRSFCFNQ